MELFFIVFMVVFAAICLLTVVLVAVPVLRNAFSPMSMSNASKSEDEIKEEITRFVQDFLSAGVKDRPGRFMMPVVESGYINSSRLGNKGKGVDDNRHMEDTRKYNTCEVVDASKNLLEYVWVHRGMVKID
jgi:hypothetical protein